MSELRFDDKVAVVTGAGGGLGKAHALLLAARGAKVVVNDLGGAVDGSGSSLSPAEQVVEEIRALGGEAVADGNTVATQAGGQAIVQSALAQFGGVHIIVNNAGILRDKSFRNMSPALFDPVIDVHLKGCVWTCHAAWEAMREQQYGRIINTSSAAGLFGNFGQTNYSAAKMGIVGLTKTLGLEGAKYNIKANVLAPGARTRMTEDLMGDRAAAMDPELVSPTVAFLAHEDCPLTGEILSASSGRVARVFVGACKGVTERENMSPEFIRDNLERIMSTEGFHIPTSAMDEINQR
ncbi:MAG: SDR family oxidoreductase [Pseudomonadota bacterium]|nr:SDR family oxidoreductase [Pseudomonadota bacterium]